MNKIYVRLMMALLALVVVVFSSFSGDYDAKGKKDRAGLAKTAGTPRYQILNINNLSTWYGAHGNGNFPPSRTGDGLYYPRATGSAIYEDGIMWGGKVFINDPRGNPSATPGPVNANQWFRVGGNEYEQGNQEGWIIGTGRNATAASPDLPQVRIYRIRRDWMAMGDDELRRDAAEFNEIAVAGVTNTLIAQIKANYAKDWQEWPVQYGAPYIDRNGNGRYDPPPPFNYDEKAGTLFTHDSLITQKRDEPGVSGADPNSPADQVLYTVYNDLNRANTTTLYGSEPMGIEGQVTLWGYKRTDALGNIYFKRVRLINKGGCVIDTLGNKGSFYIDSMYVAQWSDPDLGNAGDDLIGCDTSKSVGYIYNGNPVDLEYRQFNLAPPAAGYDFLAGPLVPAPGDSGVYGLKRVYNKKNLGMTSFAYFSAGAPISDPRPRTWSTGSFRWYQMLKGFAPIGSVGSGNAFYPFPPGDTPNKFPLAGDPVKRTGFIDGIGTDYSFPPGDRRLIMNTGPFFLAPGDTQEIVVGTVVGLGADRLSSISVMKFNDEFVQNTYNDLFVVPTPPAQPDVKVAELNNEIVLEWASNWNRVKDTETSIKNPGGYIFEGYNVYQLPSATASLSSGRRIATFDLTTDPAVITDRQVDPSGVVLEKPVQFGTNSGISRQIQIKKDNIRDIETLYNGQEYYFAVTAYSRSTTGYLPGTLESAPITLRVRPQAPKPGEKFAGAFGDKISVSKTGGSGDATVTATVVDPKQVKTGTYDVKWNANRTWTLYRGGSAYLANQSNMSGDDDYLIADGVQVKVSKLVFDPPTTVLSESANEGSGLHFWGDGTLFGNSTGFYREFVSGKTDVPASLSQWNLEIRFTGTAEGANPSNNDAKIASGGQWTTIWARAAFGASNLSAVANAQIRAPFELWDVENNKQINFALVNRNADGKSPYGNGMDAANARYRMSGRDYIIVIYSPYNAAAAQTTTFSPNDPNSTWVIFFEQGGASTWAKGDVQKVNFANPINPAADSYRFTTTAAVFGDQTLAKEQVKKVGVFPNPYYAFNPAETSRFQRFVTFNYLPDNATIRIFTLSGQIVRVLNKVAGDNTGQFFRWDLTNTYGFPVASGIYIVHVDMPDLGTSKVLKIAIIQEQEILDTY